MLHALPKQHSSRLLSENGHHEDSFVVALPQNTDDLPAAGKPACAPDYALVQSLDIIAPLGNDPRLFGQAAACNAVSDIYAMGGQAYTAMNILSFSSCDTPLDVVKEILQGAMDKITEAGAVSCGGHTLESKELRFGLSVTGIVNKAHFSQNKNLCDGDMLVLTKPLGTGVLSTGIRGKWDSCEKAEQELFRHAARLNKRGAELIQEFRLKAATDITGFGLIGHCLETAKASQKHIELWQNKIPFMDFVLEYAQNGLIPKRCYDNRNFAQKYIRVQSADPLPALLCHDPQTSGGLLLAVPEKHVQTICMRLTDSGDGAFVVGQVTGAARLPDSAQKEAFFSENGASSEHNPLYITLTE